MHLTFLDSRKRFFINPQHRTTQTFSKHLRCVNTRFVLTPCGFRRAAGGRWSPGSCCSAPSTSTPVCPALSDSSAPNLATHSHANIDKNTRKTCEGVPSYNNGGDSTNAMTAKWQKLLISIAGTATHQGIGKFPPMTIYSNFVTILNTVKIISGCHVTATITSNIKLAILYHRFIISACSQQTHSAQLMASFCIRRGHRYCGERVWVPLLETERMTYTYKTLTQRTFSWISFCT